MTWHEHAPCIGQGDIMFAPDFRPALEVCATCPRWMRQECFDAARAAEPRMEDPHGVAGGIPPHQRKYLPSTFRVPEVPGVFLKSDNPDLHDRQIRALNAPTPVPHDEHGFRIPTVRKPAAPGELVGCPSWGAVARHRKAGESCDICRMWRAEHRMAS